MSTKNHNKAMILFTVILMDFLTGMEFDLFVPSLPELQNQFNLSPFWVEASLSINCLGFCFSLFFVGALADRFGRKPIILLGLTTFVIASLLCLWSPFYQVMLAGRFFQGIGIAAPAILSFIIIADLYPLKQQQFYIAMLNGLKNASIAVAPVMGSYITLYFHWRGNFAALLLLGIFTLLMSLSFVPTFKLPEQREPLSFKGYIPLFKSIPLLLLMMHMAFLFVPYWIFVGMSPLLYMKDLGVNLTHFGYYQGILAFTFALGSVIYGFFVHQFEQKRMLQIANLILMTSFGFIVYLAINNHVGPIFITAAMLIFVIGQVIPSTLIYPICLNYMPQAKGRVSGIMGATSLILQSIGLQIAGYMYIGTFRNVGLMIAFFIFLTVLSLFWVTHNRAIMTFAEKQENQ